MLSLREQKDNLWLAFLRGLATQKEKKYKKRLISQCQDLLQFENHPQNCHLSMFDANLLQCSQNSLKSYNVQKRCTFQNLHLTEEVEGTLGLSFHT